MNVVVDNLDLYLAGMRDTVVLTLVSFVLAFVVGTVVAGFRVSPVPPLRAAGTVYVNIVRNTPLAVLIVLVLVRLLPARSGFSPAPFHGRRSSS